VSSPSSSQTILAFAYQTLSQYSDGDPPDGGVECRWDRQKSRFWTNSWLSIDDWRSVNNCDHPPCSLPRTDGHASVNLCLSQPAWTTTTKRREQNLSVRSGKSEAEVTNNRILRSTYCTIEATDRHKASASRGLSATAGLLVMLCHELNYGCICFVFCCND